METFGLPVRDEMAFKEMAICERYDSKSHGRTALWVDTNKAKWQGRRWRDLNSFYKRKFENNIILRFPKIRLTIRYR